MSITVKPKQNRSKFTTETTPESNENKVDSKVESNAGNKLEDNATKSFQKKHLTTLQANTLKVIHKCVAEYDNLIRKCNSEPTPENKQELEDYKLHLRNVSRLANFAIEIINKQEIPNTLFAFSKIRALITSEINKGTFIISDDDGLIRNPKTSPYEDVPATGNVTLIILPQKYIDELKVFLTEKLIDESVRILVPCNNTILILEVGDYTGHVNKKLSHTIFQVIMTYIPGKLGMPKIAEADWIIKYIFI